MTLHKSLVFTDVKQILNKNYTAHPAITKNLLLQHNGIKNNHCI